MIGLRKEEEEWMTRHRGPAAMERSCRDAIRKRQKGEISGERRTRARKKKETRPVSQPQPADATTSFVHDGFQDNVRKRETKSEGGRNKRGKRSAQKNRLWSTDICACEREKEREKETRTRGPTRRVGPTVQSRKPGYHADVITTAARDRSSSDVRVSSSCAVLLAFHRQPPALFSHIDSRTLAKTSLQGECSRMTVEKRNLHRSIYVHPISPIIAMISRWRSWRR